MVLFSAVILILREDLVWLLPFNMLVASLFVFLFSTLGQTLDKKLLLLGFNLHKWMLRHGLIEELDFD